MTYRWKAINLKVSKCRYLGTNITEDNAVGKEIQERIKAGNRCYGALLNIMKAKELSLKGKEKIYRTVIRPVVMYASEIWCMSKENERQIVAWKERFCGEFTSCV